MLILHRLKFMTWNDTHECCKEKKIWRQQKVGMGGGGGGRGGCSEPLFQWATVQPKVKANKWYITQPNVPMSIEYTFPWFTFLDLLIEWFHLRLIHRDTETPNSLFLWDSSECKMHICKLLDILPGIPGRLWRWLCSTGNSHWHDYGLTMV